VRTRQGFLPFPPPEELWQKRQWRGRLAPPAQFFPYAVTFFSSSTAAFETLPTTTTSHRSVPLPPLPSTPFASLPAAAIKECHLLGILSSRSPQEYHIAFFPLRAAAATRRTQGIQCERSYSSKQPRGFEIEYPASPDSFSPSPGINTKTPKNNPHIARSSSPSTRRQDG
jgi:hypothetical protein